MKWLWVCRCQRCRREVADVDRQAFDFKRGGWKYLSPAEGWICDECAEKRESPGAGRGIPGTAKRGSESGLQPPSREAVAQEGTRSNT